jgi:hypothetical protein
MIPRKSHKSPNNFSPSPNFDRMIEAQPSLALDLFALFEICIGQRL